MKEKFPRISVAPGFFWERVMPSASELHETQAGRGKWCLQLASGFAQVSLLALTCLMLGTCRSKSTGLQVLTSKRQHSPTVYSAEILTFSQYFKNS